MRRIALLSLLAALVLSPLGVPSVVADSPQNPPSMASLTPAPAKVFLVGTALGAPTTEASGVIDKRKVDADTPFLIGSISKAFTAVAVMQLVEEGHLLLDEPLGNSVPPALADVTVRQLLWHTSGLTTGAGLTRADVVDNRPGALGGLVMSFDESDVNAAPGATYQYSSANYMVLGYLVEEATQMPFGAYLEGRVLAPLGMTNSGATSDSAKKLDVNAGHRLIFGRVNKLERGYVSSGASYGYVISTAADLNRFAQWLASPETTDGPLNADAVRELTTPGPRTSTGQHYAMGLRVGSLDGEGPEVLEHTGATPGTFAHLVIVPSEKTAVVVLADIYAEALAPQLSSIGWNAVREHVGYPVRAAGKSSLLMAAPWLIAALAIGGFVIALFAARRLFRADLRRKALSRNRSLILAIVAALITAAGVLAPRLFGFGWRELMLWAPDVGFAAIATTGAWGLSALMLLGLAALSRPRA
ncbi:serine hydrolase [Hoyosella rhizosphaerae]|uniref:Beta-lactamase-related domain-containing protein n=1 Tax=Hoyosella rhizosphaerae TaxID=1755582 RepID=A0A916X8Y2_9ACTN|nr:serine hydrolase domain-containing protein [Hoyosella rhizosphaerae]MBN4926885.1 serine hydrolase [Hoyosella rhizosphaerae]GGC55748.1 hypothetical protein GCM10011410_05190 [Hoyosella rhizosphaerae]